MKQLQHPDRKIVKVWRFKYVIFSAILIIAYGIFLALLRPSINEKIFIYPTVIFILNLAAVITAAISLPILSYKRRKYLFTEDKIEIAEGIFFRVTSMIPISRVQHLTIDEGPLLRRYGLTSIAVFTTAGSFVLDGLKRDDAYTIADNLKSRVNIKVKKEEDNDKEA